jgi:hypothetical protein
MPVSDFTLDSLKHIINPPSRVQLDKKELPQSGMPVSDFTLDGLKHLVNPPSRVQLENQDVVHMRKRE